MRAASASFVGASEVRGVSVIAKLHILVGHEAQRAAERLCGTKADRGACGRSEGARMPGTQGADPTTHYRDDRARGCLRPAPIRVSFANGIRITTRRDPVTGCAHPSGMISYAVRPALARARQPLPPPVPGLPAPTPRPSGSGIRRTAQHIVQDTSQAAIEAVLEHLTGVAAAGDHHKRPRVGLVIDELGLAQPGRRRTAELNSIC